VGPTADRHEQLRALDGVSVLELDRDLAVLARDGGRLAPEADLAPALAERRADELRRELLLAGDHPRAGLDDRHPGAERAPRLTELDANDAAAEHDEVVGHRL